MHANEKQVRRLARHLAELEHGAVEFLVNGDQESRPDKRKFKGLGERNAALLVEHAYNLPEAPRLLDARLRELSPRQREFLAARELWEHSFWDAERKLLPGAPPDAPEPIDLSRAELDELARWTALPDEERQGVRELVADYEGGVPAPRGAQRELLEALAVRIAALREIQDQLGREQILEALETAVRALPGWETIYLSWLGGRYTSGPKGKLGTPARAKVLELWEAECPARRGEYRRPSTPPLPR